MQSLKNSLIALSAIFLIGQHQIATAIDNGPFYQFQDGRVYFSCGEGQFKGKFDLQHCGNGHYVVKEPYAPADCQFASGHAELASDYSASNTWFSTIRMRLKQSTSGQIDGCFLRTYVFESNQEFTLSSIGMPMDYSSPNLEPNLTSCPLRFLPGTIQGQPSDSNFRLTGGIDIYFENFNTSSPNEPDLGPHFLCKLVADIPRPTLSKPSVSTSELGAVIK